MFSHRFSIVSGAALTVAFLAGCSEPQGGAGDQSAPVVAPELSDTSPSEDADGGNGESGAEQLAIEGTAWLTIGGDGSVQTTFLDPEGRYRDLRDGVPLAEGSWLRDPDGRLCFEPDAGRGACWTFGDIGEDGEAIATDGEGKTIAIKRVAYRPPESDSEANEENDIG